MSGFFQTVWDSFIWHHATDLIVCAILAIVFVLWMGAAYFMHLYKRIKTKIYFWKKHGIKL